MPRLDATRTPRDGRGRILSRRCPDPNCGGTMQLERGDLWNGWWRCDGLTHYTDDGPLFACEEMIAPPYLQEQPHA